MTRGIELDDGPIAADKARALPGSSRTETLVELTLHSGRNRIVRRMMDAVGHPVIELVRRQFGPLHLGTLPVGRTRDLTKVELGQLLTIARSAEATGGRVGEAVSRTDFDTPPEAATQSRGFDTPPEAATQPAEGDAE